MTPLAPAVHSLEADESSSPEERILSAAHDFLFIRHSMVFTMDDLAGELGMSKKTIYLHFPGKDALLSALIERLGTRMRSNLESIVSDPSLCCAEKLCRLIDRIGTALSRLRPSLLRDLKKEAPHLYQKLEDIRRRNIPHIFGRLVADGIREGGIRSDVDPVFAAEFWFHAMRGLLDPETLERTQMTPRQMLEKAIPLFFQGLLNDQGRRQYRQHIESCTREKSA